MNTKRLVTLCILSCFLIFQAACGGSGNTEEIGTDSTSDNNNDTTGTDPEINHCENVCTALLAFIETDGGPDGPDEVGMCIIGTIMDNDYPVMDVCPEAPDSIESCMNCLDLAGLDFGGGWGSSGPSCASLGPLLGALFSMLTPHEHWF